MATFPFEIQATEGKARTGVLRTSRGDIRTPAFMPVGTAGTVKALYMDQVRDAGADIILGNTYHLMLRPGAERVKRLGGLHAFAHWSARGRSLGVSGGSEDTTCIDDQPGPPLVAHPQVHSSCTTACLISGASSCSPRCLAGTGALATRLQ